MFDYLDTYLWTLAGNAKWLLTGAFFALDTFVKKCFPSFAAKIDKRVSAKLRWRFEIGLFALAVFFAGFLAWKAEHVARLKDEGTIQVRRHLTNVEKEKLKKVFDGHQSDFPLIAISVVSDVESQTFAREFVKLFSDMKFRTEYLPGAVPSEEEDKGLMVGVHDPAHPSDAAKLFIKLFLEAGFRVKQVESPLDFDLFIGLPENLY